MADPWRPTTVIQFEANLDTSTGVARVVTDAGKAYLKALGNPEGPHVLACEWVGTQLAAMMDIPVAECAIIQIQEEDEIPLGHDRWALPGPAFVSRALKGHNWSGSERELRLVENPEDISRIVVFDTWTRNIDRHPPEEIERKPNYDNVFLSEEDATPKRPRLVALDHTHCFTGGRELTTGIAHIQIVQDERFYGLFPEFRRFVRPEVIQATAESLARLDRNQLNSIIATVPNEWEVSAASREAWADFLLRRATYLSKTISQRIQARCWPGPLFN